VALTNQVSNPSPLVDNQGLSEGDVVLLRETPLRADTIDLLIPE